MENWYVFYTYPKSEKVIKRDLEKLQFEVFLPLYKVTRQWTDRKKVIEWPVFPNYIFVKTVIEKVYHILTHPKIVKYIAFEGRPATLKEEEITFINTVIKIDSNFYMTPFQKGDKVRIKEGLLKGYEGILTEIKRKKNFGFYLKEVKQMIWIDISKVRIEKLNQACNLYI